MGALHEQVLPWPFAVQGSKICCFKKYNFRFIFYQLPPMFFLIILFFNWLWHKKTATELKRPIKVNSSIFWIGALTVKSCIIIIIVIIIILFFVDFYITITIYVFSFSKWVILYSYFLLTHQIKQGLIKLLGKAKYLEENIIVIMIYLLDGTIKETNQSCQKIAKKS